MDLIIRPELPLAAILGYSALAFFVGLFLTQPFVRFLKRHKIGKQLRSEAVDGGTASVFLTYHQSKAGTPTMGGILIWGSIVVTVLISRALSFTGQIPSSLLQRGQVYLPLFSLLALALLGALDDYLNVTGVGSKKGLNAMPKLLTLLFIGSAVAWWFYFKLEYNSIHVPFGEYIGITGGILDLGWLYIPFVIITVVGMANAVNVTDGLDGLAAGLLIVAFGSFGLIAYVEGLTVLAGFCGVIVGAIVAFLWHNVPPALFYMGDTGSLALGGTLAIMAFMIDQVMVLPLIGAIFAIEILSVIIQLLSKRFRGKKVFLAAPIHHHFEAKGWGESKVTMRLWIIGGFLAFLGVLIAING